MADDVLILGGIAFTGYGTPDAMPAGGQQAMVVHKLPGGGRVIDLLGPDEDDIRWQGQFFGDDAYSNALALDAMRAAGQVIPLTWAGQYRLVVIKYFRYRIRRLPVWVEYEICCTVYENPALGSLDGGTSSIDDLVSSDLDSASDSAAGDAPIAVAGNAQP